LVVNLGASRSSSNIPTSRYVNIWSVMRKGNHCWVCGVDNASGLGVRFEPDGANGSLAYYTARPEHGGWPGVLHGGVALTLMDEAFGWSLYFHGSAGLTARFDARLRQQIPIGAQLVIRAWTTEKRKKFAKARAEIRQDSATGRLLAEAKATMFIIVREPASTAVDANAALRRHASTALRIARRHG
jgi:acyl-coenzyme A thioesterase PaaI-like protein